MTAAADHRPARAGQAGPAYRLAPPPSAGRPPVLDADQQRVVDHPGGPMLVLAGPGTGKTTTLVEAIARRVEDGARPDQVLALTFSRKAAEQLRDRVTARLGRTMATPLSMTFHSFAYGLIRELSPAELYESPLRLLSAPESDVVLRELLADTPESVAWPEDLTRALGTRGFAREVHAVLSRAREKGLEGEALADLGRREGEPALVAAGLFLDQYLTVLDAQGATDHPDLIRRATLEAEAHRGMLRERIRHVFVDEYQDTDPGQVALLRALAGDGRDLVVVGDPHQSIYGFRGAEVRGILEFPTAFPRADGRAAEVVALRSTRRFGPRLLAASQRVAGRLGLPGTIDEGAREAFLAPRALTAAEGGARDEGRVQVRTFDTDRAEAENLADLLRRAHLERGVSWDDMAVLVRSGRTTIPPLRRALAAAGVPVEVGSDEVPLVRDPAVLPLVDALRAVVHLDTPAAPEGEPEDLDHVGPARAEALLTGPLGGLDAGEVRRLARRLRAREKELAHEQERTPRPSRELVRELVVDAGFAEAHLGVLPAPEDAPELARALAVTRLLAATRARLDDGDTAEELLWDLWSGTGWPARLRRAVEAGGAAARRAHRDLDSVCALFEVAARAGEQRDHLGVSSFLSTLVAQQIPGDTLADRGTRGAAVRLLTAHRSKGLEWDLVVVAHVQAEGWPDLRRRSTLLQADRIGQGRTGPGGALGELVPPTSARELLAEERRLFYVACTRARSRLVVTAVRSPEDEGEQPSRFLEELGLEVEHVVGRPRRPLSMDGLVAELRRTLADPEQPEGLRRAAARRLARLSGELVGSSTEPGARRLVPQAHPSSWWGTRAASVAPEPVRPADEPVPLSASVLEALGVCPMQWFLAQEAGGVVRAHQSANLGQIVHALAEKVAAGEIEAGPDDVDVLMGHVDEVWGRLEFRTPWSAQREYARIRHACAKFLTWHHAGGRRLVGTEARFGTVLDLDDGEQVRLHGYADRVELDAQGGVVVVDLKTGRSKPSNKSVEQHLQLGVYQLAVDEGAVDGLVGAPARAGGAELVQLGLEDSETAVVQAQEAPDPDGPFRAELGTRLRRAAVMLRQESFPAIAGQHCRDCPFVPLCPIKSAGAVVTQ
ncbi:ATP-dependent helicase [Nocardioides bruguierae]|uniref:ATP-dependent helicase n=1 Tax=Nocardioides bruguierae TaxID=2945102 RepID=UPI0020203A54|nr:ATP-dependent DNA helicase [Nocardioides bruguierae]MCL8024918.1 ATP-dependent helicase [Nocardioides bruguierae]